MSFSNTLSVQHFYKTRHGLTQDRVNKILRSKKQRFGKSQKLKPKQYMDLIARRELSKYQDPNRYHYHFFSTWDNKLGPWDELKMVYK